MSVSKRKVTKKETDSGKIEKLADEVWIADEVWNIYSAFLKKGFDVPQAFELTKIVIKSCE